MIKLEKRKQHKSNQLQVYNKEQEKNKPSSWKIIIKHKRTLQTQNRCIHKDI